MDDLRNRSLGELFTELSRDVSVLVRKEIELARLEMSRPKPESAPAPDKNKAAKAPGMPRFLDFKLATADPGKPEAAP